MRLPPGLGLPLPWVLAALLSVGLLLSSCSAIASGTTNTLSGHHSCVRGLAGMSWSATHVHSTYADIVADEPEIAFHFFGTIRPLAGSSLLLISAHTAIFRTVPYYHVYAVVDWPSSRPRPAWLIVLASPSSLPSGARPVTCQR